MGDLIQYLINEWPLGVFVLGTVIGTLLALVVLAF
jgi:uncharacterized integral membrane protein